VVGLALPRLLLRPFKRQPPAERGAATDANPAIGALHRNIPRKQPQATNPPEKNRMADREQEHAGIVARCLTRKGLQLLIPRRFGEAEQTR